MTLGSQDRGGYPERYGEGEEQKKDWSWSILVVGLCLFFLLHYFKENLDPIFLEHGIISGFDVCSKMAQFKMYEQLYFSFNFNELRYTEDETGCLHPCSYSEYEIADKQVHGIEEGFGLYIAYGTLAVTVKREVQ